MPATAAANYTPVRLIGTIATAQDNKQHHHNNRRDDAESSAVCDYRSAADAAAQETFIREAVRLMLEQAVFRGTDRKSPVLKWKGPEQLQAAFDFQLNRSATTHGHLLRLIEDTIEHSVKTGHPYFINQLFSGYVI